VARESRICSLDPSQPLRIFQKASRLIASSHGYPAKYSGRCSQVLGRGPTKELSSNENSSSSCWKTPNHATGIQPYRFSAVQFPTDLPATKQDTPLKISELSALSLLSLPTHPIIPSRRNDSPTLASSSSLPDPVLRRHRRLNEGKRAGWLKNCLLCDRWKRHADLPVLRVKRGIFRHVDDLFPFREGWKSSGSVSTAISYCEFVIEGYLNGSGLRIW
jgi:hypothetical protein